MIEKRIDFLEKKLKQYNENSEQRMKNRKTLFTVSLLGYTNAGKTTLMNALTKGKLYADDRLFTTLETTTRRLFKEILLTDTIGFLANLPHELINSFSLTLKEVYESDLKLIVLDISDEYIKEKYDDVNKILDDLYPARNDRIYILNKTDSLIDISGERYLKEHIKNPIFISAKNLENVSLVRDIIMEKFLLTLQKCSISVERDDAECIKFIYANGYVGNQKVKGRKMLFELFLSERNLSIFQKRFKEAVVA